MRLLAIDPGLTTGWMIWQNGFSYAGQAEPPNGFLNLAWSEMPAVDVVVMEEFRITDRTMRTTREPWSLHIIGAVAWMAERHGAELVMQSPGDAKAFATNTKLKRLGWPLKGDHAKDAGRHALLYLVRSGALTGKDLL